MRNIALIVMLFLLNSCSLNNLFLSEEIDTVTVVKYTPYVKHHRAYFTRTHLQVITGNQKYYFLYHPKKQELAVLLHRKDQYLLYNFTKPETPAMSLKTKTKTSFRKVLRVFKNQGYVRRNLKALGYAPSVALRRYKGVKTLMIEVKDYRRLKKLYVKAIQNYNAKEIRSIKTVLPKNLIYAHYENYRKRAKTSGQLAQLQIIANKLGFNSNIPKKKRFEKKSKAKATKQIEQKKEIEEEPEQPEAVQAITEEEEEAPVVEVAVPVKEVYTPPKMPTKGYSYYRNHASLGELRRYLSKSETRSSLPYSKYKKLQRYAGKLQEEQLLNDGSLEELIAAYKVNKKSKYKQRIMELMKDKQESN